MNRPQGAALAFARKGWPVFPLNGKVPFRGTQGFKDATTDEGQIHEWWNLWPHANTGVPTGGPINLWVLDVDPRHGGDVTLAALEAEHGPLPLTVEVVTGGGGRHLYWALTPDAPQRNAQAALPGLDIRSTGGYVVVPPSIHPDSGAPYRWLPWEAGRDIPEAPTWLLRALSRPPQRPTGQHSKRTPGATHDPARDRGRRERYAAKVLQTACETIRATSEGARHDTLRAQARMIGGYVGGGAIDIEHARAMLQAAGLESGLPRGEVQSTVAYGLEHGQAEPLYPPDPDITPGTPGPKARQPSGTEHFGDAPPEQGEPIREEPHSHPGALNIEHCTDMGNAKRLVRVHGQDIRYCAEHGRNDWLAWDGTRWVPDLLRVLRLAKEVPSIVDREAEQVEQAAKQASDEKEQERLKALGEVLRKHARRCESERAQKDLRTSARSEVGVAVGPNELDADRWLLNCENGTLDLRTGRLQEHTRGDLITNLAPVAYDPNACAPLWDAFLTRIFAEDPELVAFMQRLAGYVLVGGNTEQVFPIFHGKGANGKSTFVEALRRIMGDYAGTAPPQAFTNSRDSSVAKSAALASLAGTRLVTLAETQEGQGLDEGMVKSTTGGEPIPCCFKYGPWFSFQPQFTPWLSTNHRPRIRGTDDGIWRRLRLVPFAVSIPKHEQDPDLGDKLWEERAGILSWAVEGCRQWREQGLSAPAAVADATREYRGEEDTVAQFVDECCERDPDARVGNGDLYSTYREWCERNGSRAFGRQKFTPRMKALGFVQKNDGRRYWPGLRLLPHTAAERRHA